MKTNKFENVKQKADEMVLKVLTRKHSGVDGVVVALALCVISVVVCVTFNEAIGSLLETVTTGMATKIQGILGS